MGFKRYRNILTDLFATLSFTTVQTPAGTSPAADAVNGTLTLTSSDDTIEIAGNATTDTVDFKLADSADYMLKSEYDTNDDGAVENAALLGGQNSAYHLSRTNHTGTQASSTISDFDSAADARIAAQKAAANGLATLGVDGKIPSAQINPIAISSVYVVASEVAQLALTAQEGDIAKRTDLTPIKVYIHNGGTAGTMADWTDVTTQGDVQTVNGQTGSVVLTTTNVAEGTNLYHTTSRARSAAVLNTLAGSETDQAPSVAATKTSIATKENSLGNPGTNGHVLSSTTGGTRSWVSPTPEVSFWSLARALPWGAEAPTVTTPAAITLTAGRVFPFSLTGSLVVNKVLIRTNVALSNCAIWGIFDSTGTRVWQSGLTSTVGTGFMSITTNLPVTLTGGTYYFALTTGGNTNGTSAFTVSSTLGTANLPHFGTFATTNGDMPTSITLSSITPTQGGWPCYVILSKEV